MISGCDCCDDVFAAVALLDGPAEFMFFVVAFRQQLSVQRALSSRNKLGLKS